MNQLNDSDTLDVVYDTYLKSVLKIEQGKLIKVYQKKVAGLKKIQK